MKRLIADGKNAKSGVIDAPFWLNERGERRVIKVFFSQCGFQYGRNFPRNAIKRVREGRLDSGVCDSIP